MRRTTLLLMAVVLFLAPLALLGASRADGSCTPVSDPTAREVDTPAATLYVKTSQVTIRNGLGVPAPSQVWRESNDIPGLQTSSDMACGAQPDFLWIDDGV
jgi:hypothetical protein